jgi:hypothetical protein
MAKKKTLEKPVTSDLDLSKVDKYIELLYSPDSVLNNNQDTLKERQLKAADMAGFKRNKDGYFDKVLVEELFNLKNEDHVKKILAFLKKKNNQLWTDIVVTESELEELFRHRLTPVSDDKDKDNLGSLKMKAELGNITAKRRKDLQSFYNEFFGKNEDLKAVAKAKSFTLEDLAE